MGHEIHIEEKVYITHKTVLFYREHFSEMCFQSKIRSQSRECASLRKKINLYVLVTILKLYIDGGMKKITYIHTDENHSQPY